MPTLAGTESVTSRVRVHRCNEAGTSVPVETTVLAGRVRPNRSAVLQRATELCAQGLETPFAKVLEYMPEEKRLLMSAGVGWEPETIGQVSLGVDLESPAGYAFHTGQIVISNHLQEETHFRTPKLLSEHRIKRAINVLIARGGEGHLPFGVSGSRQRRRGPIRSCGCRFPCRLCGPARHRHRAAACRRRAPKGPAAPGHVDPTDRNSRTRSPSGSRTQTGGYLYTC